MAVVKQMHMKSDNGNNPSRHLKNAIDYVLRPNKCEGGRLAGAKNCVAESNLAYEQMMQTKRAFGKLHGRQGYHYVISFAQGEVSPEIALEITGKFVDEYLQGMYEVVYAVHTDADHIHSHIVFNSVGIDGYKYHAPKGEWEHAIMPIVNKLCRQYGLSEMYPKRIAIEDQELPKEEETESDDLEPDDRTLGEPEPDRMPYSEYRETKETRDRGRQAEHLTGDEQKKDLGTQQTKRSVKNPKYGRKGSGYGGSAATMSAMIRRDIDECIGESDTMETFYRLMRERGYRLRITGNREPGLQHESMERIRRFSSLGEGYTLEEIEAAILGGEKPMPEPGIPEERLPESFQEFDEQSSGEVPSHLHREMRYRFLISAESYSRAAYFPRAKHAVEEFEDLREAYEFVRRNNIRTTGDIERLRAATKETWRTVQNELRNAYRGMQSEQTKKVMDLVKQYRSYADAVLLYQHGDPAFYEDYMEAQWLKERIQAHGVTIQEAEEAYEKDQQELEWLKGRYEETSKVLRKISRLKTMLKLETPRETAQALEHSEAEKQKKRTARERERRR